MGRGPESREIVPDARLTALLRRAGRGDAAAEASLFRAVYDELHRQADRLMRGQPHGHTLQATALVHEVFLKVGRAETEWADRAHFLATAATAMRQILVDHARARRREKRGGDHVRVSLDAVLAAFEAEGHDMIDIDDELRALAEIDARAASVVEMRCFGDMTSREMAARLGVSERTVERDWDFGRTWLEARLSP